MRLLCIDPALRKTGYAVIEQAADNSGSKTSKKHDIRCLEYGVIDNKQSLSQSACLVQINDFLGDVINKYKPEECAVEAVIYVQSYKTAITLGAARGAAILAAAQSGLPVFEYPPKRVKQAVVGKGAAAKPQVAFMVRALLHLKETPPPDAADALAIGIAHLQSLENKTRSSETIQAARL